MVAVLVDLDPPSLFVKLRSAPTLDLGLSINTWAFARLLSTELELF